MKRVARHVAIVGPTASGKSHLALALARRDPRFEIVSLDSMQVYRGMDIGTAKATAAERSEVCHHLVDVVDAADDWSVARTQAGARAAVADIEARGGRALLVGGTGLYVQAVVDGFDLPGEDLEVRAALEAATSAPGGLLEAWRELQRLDPAAAARIDEHNQRRIVRALEVIRITGRPFSSFGPGVFPRSATAPAAAPETTSGSDGWNESGDGTAVFDVRLLGVWTARGHSVRQITQRVERMRADGLADEVAELLRHPWARAARQAIGYKEIAAALETSSALDDAFALIVRRTRSFARRQRMWFRRDPRIVWIAGTDLEATIDAAHVVCAAGGPS